MAELNYRFFHGEIGLIHKDQTEEKILDVIKNSKDKNFDAYLETSQNSKEFCYLSNVRENILNWYPFKSNSELLEIGAGLGTLTGMFCDKVKKVTSVEMTDVRAQSIYEWHKEKENLEIIVGNFNEMVFEKKFDYIVLIGVYEYSKRFLESENAHVEFLKKLKSLLTSNGIILIGIENRLGLKYFSGYKEEHADKLFLSLNSYDGYDYIRTFSKSELTEIAVEAGFSKHQFMYPFPDYGYPSAIYTDNSIQYIKFGQPYLYPRNDYFEFFDEFRMYETMRKEGIVTSFSNSFLLELFNENENENEEKIIYAKISSCKKTADKVATVIIEKDQMKIVKKYPLGDKAKISLMNYPQIYARIRQHKAFHDFTYIEAIWKDDHIEMPFIDHISIEEKLNKQLDLALKCSNQDSRFYKKNINEIYSIFISIVEKLRKNAVITNDYHGEEFSCYFGEDKIASKLECIDYANIDCRIDNFYVDNEDNIFVIDYEYTVDFLVPVDYLAFCLINSWYNENVLTYKNAEKLLDVKKIYNVTCLNLKNIEIYSKWNRYCHNKIYNWQAMRNVDKKACIPNFIIE